MEIEGDRFDMHKIEKWRFDDNECTHSVATGLRRIT